MRPWEGVQRGSVMDMPVYPGDPLTPGWGSVEGGRKLPMSEAKTLMKIPVLPISYQDARPLLESLVGPVVPESWRGALPITYHVGPGPGRVHLALKFDWKSRPLYDVIARVPGTSDPDQWIIYGNHHDAWVNGAADPLSGQVALDETARAIGTLLQTGWKPSRTIIFAAWDGEEWGLLGSTEWAEQHADELESKAAVYLNSDTNKGGWLTVSGSHSLQEFFRELARDIEDPESDESALEVSLAHRKDSSAFSVGALGSGSDYTVFIDHLGVASANAAYGGATHDGFYHSIYDSFDAYTRFADTSFAYGVAEARTMATALLRLADAPVLPFEFTAVARTYRGYADEIAHEAAADGKLKDLDLTAVDAALDRLERAADRYESVMAGLSSLDEAALRRKRPALTEVNRTLYRTERALADPNGLPGRAWFRHLVYAPGLYTGYGVKTMAGVREAVEDKPDLAVAQLQAARLAAALDRYTAQVDRAADELEEALR